VSEVELVLDAHALNGETPTWSVAEQKLYWIDIEEPALHRFDPASGGDKQWRMPSEIGAFALCEDGRVLAALRTGLLRIDLERRTSELLATPPYDPLSHRFNDGKCDPQGRFWIGTMFKPLDGSKADEDTPPTPLFVWEGRELRTAPASAVISNGLAWSPDGRTMYFSDSHAQIVRCYDFEPANGAVSNEREFARFNRGVPDGAAVDEEGCYWVADYDGGRVVRFCPNGEREREIRLPVSEPTMCAFGGPDLRDLYITSARSGLSPARRPLEPLAGGLFRYRAPVPGLPATRFI
jgi:sugar lactone lactonase YvrE